MKLSEDTKDILGIGTIILFLAFVICGIPTSCIAFIIWLIKQ